MLYKKERVPIEWCFGDIAINILFWLTCQALLIDFSRIKAAIGEKITGGRFSYIIVFQKSFQENFTGEWYSEALASLEALLNFAAS